MPEPNNSDLPSGLHRYPLRLTAAALALGIVADVLFRRQAPGISFPIWSLLSALALWLAARWEGRRLPRISLAFTVALLAVSAGVAVRLEPLTVALSMLATLGLFILWLRAAAGDRLIGFGWLDLVYSAISVPIETLLRPWSALTDAIRLAAGDRAARSRGLAIVRGLLLAVPVLFVFVALLASADLVFEDVVQQALSWLDFDWIRDLLSHGFIITIGGLVSLGALVTALRRNDPRQLIGEQNPLIPRFLGTTESVVVLSAVDLVFLVFVIIQFRYLFGGEANISEAGYTYADYARRGFGEMVWAAILGQGLILAFGQWTKTQSNAQRATVNALSAGLVAMLLVTLSSAMTRLLLYERAYGFTRARTYGHVLIFWLAALLVSLAVLLYREQTRRYAPIAVLAALGFVLTLSALNVDRFIAAQNMDRFEATGDLDVQYLGQLTSDALPELSRRVDGDSPPELLAHLACRSSMLQDQLERASWQSFNLGRQNARRSLDEIAELLAPYAVERDGIRYQVSGPGVEEVDCGGQWLD